MALMPTGIEPYSRSEATSELANDALLGSTPFANGTPAEHPNGDSCISRLSCFKTRSG
jgi:hypothetical protein